MSVVFLVFGCFMYVSLKHYLEENLKQKLEDRAEQISSQFLFDPEALDPAWLSRQINARFSPENNGRFVRVTLNETNILFRSSNPRDGSLDASQIPRVTGEKKKGFRNERAVVLAGLPVESPQGRFFVEVGASRAPIAEVLNQAVIAIMIAAPASILVAMIAGYFLVSRALKPVAQVASTAEKITFHNLNETIPETQSGDELEKLTVALNRMIFRLNDSVGYTKRFIADASHELRTPLTIIQGELERLAQNQELPSHVRESIGSSLEEVERLTKIVEGLFALSRLDAGEAQSESVTFDFTKLAQTTAEQMSLLAEDKNLKLTCEGQSPMPVLGDRSRLKQVIVNLVDNAIKYTPAGGQVKIVTRVICTNACLEVIDNGIGIPSEAVPHVFERFFRVDKARSREMGGAGLGLSIVRSICNAHGAHLEVISTEGLGTKVQVILPLSFRRVEEGLLRIGKKLDPAPVDKLEKADRPAFG